MADPYGEFTSLEFDRPEPSILRITLRNPKKLNAVGHDAHGQLAAVWQTIDRDPDTRVVLVRGADGAFSSGGDLDLVEDIARDWDTRLRVFHEARDLVYNIVDCSKPIVAAIDGHASAPGSPSRFSPTSHRRALRADRRRAHAPRRRGRRPRGDRVAAPLRACEGEVPPAALRAARRRRSGADRARLALRAGGRARGQSARVARRLAAGSQAAIRHTKLALNNWLRAAGPAFDASLALEFLDMTGPDVAEGIAAVRGRRPPAF